jgi:hypothetical protein
MSDWPPHALCDVVYALLIQNLDEEGRTELDADLAAPIGREAEAEQALIDFLKG